MNQRVFRALTYAERDRLAAQGNRAEDWSLVEVCEPFDVSSVEGCRFGGRVRIGSGSRLIDSNISNYEIGARSQVCCVTAMECRHRSTFGNGVEVAAVNECGGRTVRIFDTLTAQTAYILAMYRHRLKTVERMESFTDRIIADRASDMGRVGDECRIVGARFIRETSVGNRVTIDGASLLENGTLGDGAYVGIDVKARDFIAVADSHIDTGAVVERSFVGERVTLGGGFTALDSLFFAGSHCENGEAVSIFAGPCTVSHHKSSLLIAGMFSFFNAGSGTNQSNHLFKAGAVHQAIHARGSKFASNAYVMAPAHEGPFTMIMGRHSKHHDTSAMPFSYLIEQNGVSMLMPGMNLRSYGTMRDIVKWPGRDKRTLRMDNVNYEEYNPYLAGKALRAIDVLKGLRAENPDAESYVYRATVIKASMLAMGLKLYEKYLAASLGAMLEAVGDEMPLPEAKCAGDWVDMAGQYIPKNCVEELLDGLESGDAGENYADSFALWFGNYRAMACSWALLTLGTLLGREPSVSDIAGCIERGRRASEELHAAAMADLQKEKDEVMRVGYGIDSTDPAVRDADFCAVRGD